ncbi:hypothetical protein LCGC14_3011620 [marine sediment metagenome]|uniref:Uncharacterized protein n=1 Tax=marine sediment metagenome TaxID=412755 RepID=A0A0F8ZP81_9ZZZZ
MPHPTPQNFVQAVVAVMDEYVKEHQDHYGPGEPYESHDQIDGLFYLLQDFGLYLAHRDWDDKRDNPELTDKRVTGTVLKFLSNSGP